MKLYELTWGVYPRRVIIYLAEKGVSDIERVPLDFLRGENRQPEHLVRNPAGTFRYWRFRRAFSFGNRRRFSNISKKSIRGRI
jgi:hypothetical protein